MLEAVGLVDIKTTTPWYSGEMVFSGIPMQLLMEKVGARGNFITVQSLNYETTEIPMKDIMSHHPLLALKRNGIYMPLNDKGPLVILYPFSSNKELNTPKYFEQSSWSVEKIVIK